MFGFEGMIKALCIARSFFCVCYYSLFFAQMRINIGKNLFTHYLNYGILIKRMRLSHFILSGGNTMKHVKTLATRNLKESMKKGGCGECQTSCQSACKTSCTVGNQSCEQLAKN
ncbi:six-cysteine peptide SCIFF [Butyrivibrio sp. TB]|nr:six-cysteine peptide SCIFF [Butyrivibrio sp. TB]